MAKYFEQNGKLVPVDKDGKVKPGAKEFHVSATPNKSFKELIRDKQAGGEDARDTGAPTPPPAAAQFKVTCEGCGLDFSSMELAEMHKCEGRGSATARPEVYPDSRSGEAGSTPAPSPICALEGCNKRLVGKRPNARYCSGKCKRRASYLRRTANG